MGVIALSVPDAAAAFHETTRRGAAPAIEPTEERDEHGTVRYAAIHAYGDTLIKFIERDDYAGVFAPGFQPRTEHGAGGTPVGLTAIDHIVGNVELGGMDRWVQFFADTMGFTQLVHFDDKAISTEYSALMSKVMQDGTGRIKFPINEPATGKRKSQIQEYLDYYGGPGRPAHRAARPTTSSRPCRSCARAAWSSCACRAPTTRTWSSASARSTSRSSELAELGIMADRDDEGYLLQIFTDPVRGSADAVLRDHRAARRARVRRGQLQVAVRGDRARAGAPRQSRLRS